MTATPTYLVTGAGGGVGGVGRIVVEELAGLRPAPCGRWCTEKTTAQKRCANTGAEVVVGDLTDPVAVAVALDGVTRMFFSMSVSASYLEATTVVCSLAADMADLDVLVNMSQMTVSQMTPTSTSESHHQRLHWLAEHVIDWSPIPAVQIRPTVFLENPLFTLLAARSIREQSVLALPFGDGRTSPIAAGDVADAVSAVLRDPAQHIGAVYELTGPTTLDIDGLAAQYSNALGREITGQRVGFDDWKMGSRPLASITMCRNTSQRWLDYTARTATTGRPTRCKPLPGIRRGASKISSALTESSSPSYRRLARVMLRKNPAVALRCARERGWGSSARPARYVRNAIARRHRPRSPSFAARSSAISRSPQIPITEHWTGGRSAPLVERRRARVGCWRDTSSVGW